ncbi:diphthamide synthesis protein [archaeon]|nr:diphthamide synthesis protein [archaeon]MBL7056946.1 diphthamide synthesis protein [Candidatus Woesearchaeota archaeon]
MYNFDLKPAIKEIKESKAKKVLLHLPDGLKPRAKDIQEELERKTKAKIFIWAGSCYGSCDLPVESKNLGIDLILHFGHTKWSTT